MPTPIRRPSARPARSRRSRQPAANHRRSSVVAVDPAGAGLRRDRVLGSHHHQTNPRQGKRLASKGTAACGPQPCNSSHTKTRLRQRATRQGQHGARAAACTNSCAVCPSRPPEESRRRQRTHRHTGRRSSPGTTNTSGHTTALAANGKPSKPRRSSAAAMSFHNAASPAPTDRRSSRRPRRPAAASGCRGHRLARSANGCTKIRHIEASAGTMRAAR